MAYGDDNKLPTDLSDATRYAEQAIGLWPHRNDRMAADHRAWAIPEPDKPNRFQLSDSHAQIEAACQLGANADMQIRAVAHDDPSRAPAQMAEDWYRAVVGEHERRFANNGGGEWKHLMFWSVATRGWLVLRVLFDPTDQDFPLQIALLDPMEVYPADREDMGHCIVHRYDATLGALWRDWGKARVTEALDSTSTNGKAPDTSVTHEITAFYTATQFAVLVNNKWLKKPVDHGYGQNPVGIFLARGSAFRSENQALRNLRRERGDTDDDLTDLADRFIGTSLIHAIRIAERDKQNVTNLQMDMLRGAARPPSVAFVQNPKELNRVPQEPGSTATLRAGEAYQRYPPDGSALQYAVQMAQQVQGEIWQSGLNQALMGDMQGANGYHQALLGEAGARVLKPYMAAYARGWEFILGTAARLYSRFGAAPMPYLAPNRFSGTVGLQKIDPHMLFNADYGLEVKFGELGFSDLQQMSMVATQLLDRGIVSHEWALDNLLHIDNPTQIRMQALRDQALKDPELMKIRMLVETARDPMDPDLALFSRMLLQKVYQEFQLSISTPPQPPQQPPLPGSGVPSMAQPGNQVIPNELLQPGMAPNAPAPPGVASPEAGIPALLAALGQG